MIVALLAFYDEEPDMIEATVRSLAPLCSTVVAVDGRYAAFPGERTASAPVVRKRVVDACRESGMRLEMHTPTEPFASESAKRALMISLGQAHTCAEDFYLVIDADEVMAHGDLEGAVLEHDVYSVGYHDPRNLDATRLRRVYRALPGLTVGRKHFQYVTADGRLLNGAATDPVVAAGDLSDRIVLTHRNHERSPGRRDRARVYYGRRHHLKLEVDSCFLCNSTNAVISLPVTWEGTPGGGVNASWGDVCYACVARVRADNRTALAALGLDETVLFLIGDGHRSLADLYRQ